MDKNVLVIGAAGLVGRAVCEVFSACNYKVYAADKALLQEELLYVDILDKELLKKVIREVSPQVVIVTAALSYVDYCEENPEESKRINLQGIDNIIDCIDPKNTLLIFFSSDYIFDGDSGPYSEDDTPNPLNVYGRHKLAAETLIARRMKNRLIIRTTWVYGPEVQGKNFVSALLKKLKNKEKAMIPDDQFGSPTYSFDIAKVLELLVKNNKRGVYNIVGPQVINRFEFAKKVCEIFDLPSMCLSAVHTGDLKQKALRPLKGGLKVEKLRKELGVVLNGHEKGLIEFKKYLLMESNNRDEE